MSVFSSKVYRICIILLEFDRFSMCELIIHVKNQNRLDKIQHLDYRCETEMDQLKEKMQNMQNEIPVFEDIDGTNYFSFFLISHAKTYDIHVKF